MLLRLSDLAATRDVPLTLTNVVNDAMNAAGAQGYPTAQGSSWIGPAVALNAAADPDMVLNNGNVTSNAGTTVTQETTLAKTFFNGRSAKIVCPGAGGGAEEGVIFGGTPGTVAPAEVWSSSAWVYHEFGSAVRFFCRTHWRKSDGTGISTLDGTSVSVPSGVKTRVTIPNGTAPALTDRISLKVIKDAADSALAVTFWCGGALPEKSPICNPYTPTSRSAGRVQVPYDPGLFTATQGWVAFLNRMGWANTAAPSANATAFAFGNDSTNRLALQYDGASAQDFRRRNSGGAGLNAGGPSATFAVGGVTMFLASWTAAGIFAAADGGAIAGNANTTIPTVTATSFDIGSATGLGLTGREWGADFLWFVCGNGPITSAQSAALFAAFGSATKPKPTIRSLDQVARAAHAMAVWDGRTGTFQRRVAA